MDRTDLHKAALLGNAERVKELLKKGADPNTQDKYGRTPLHKAALGAMLTL
jgi:ankyrin repeat protein